jgi:predicted RNA-binding Zn ribbon-like protein
MVGGILCLDFCNTTENRTGLPEFHEQLTTYSRLVGFARQAGLLEEDELAHLLGRSASQPEHAGRTLGEALQLRETLFRVFNEVAHQREPFSEDMVELNRLVQRSLSRRRVERSEAGFEWRWQGKGDSLDCILWPVIESAAELLVGAQTDRIRACEGNCGYLFLDLSKNRSRRWCLMSVCGARAKNRRHYARTRAARAQAS